MNRQDIQFMGKMTAGITHEMNNVLAIIKEAGGLMEDLLAMSGGDNVPKVEKWQRSLGRIKDQVDRGVVLSRTLNRFAHSMDDPAAAVDLGGMLDQARVLNERFARLKKVDLRSEAESGIRFQADPFGLLLVLSACIEACLAVCQTGAEIRLTGARGADGVFIDVAVSAEGVSGPLESIPFADGPVPAGGVRVGPLERDGLTGLRVILAG